MWFKKNPNEIKIGNDKFYIKSLTFEEAVEIFFDLVPYIRNFRKIKELYKSDQNADYHFMIQILLEELDKDLLYKIFSMSLGMTKESIGDLPMKYLVFLVYPILKLNKLLDLYVIFKKLGVFD